MNYSPGKLTLKAGQCQNNNFMHDFKINCTFQKYNMHITSTKPNQTLKTHKNMLYKRTHTYTCACMYTLT